MSGGCTNATRREGRCPTNTRSWRGHDDTHGRKRLEEFGSGDQREELGDEQRERPGRRDEGRAGRCEQVLVRCEW
jgi:hypothetical protein